MLTSHKQAIPSNPPPHYQPVQQPPLNTPSPQTTTPLPPLKVYASGTFNKVLSICLPGQSKDKPEYTATTQKIAHPDFTLQRTGGPVLAQATYARLGTGIEADLFLPSGTQHIQIKKDSRLHRTRSFSLFGHTYAIKATSQGKGPGIGGKDFKLVDVAQPEKPYVYFRMNHEISAMASARRKEWGGFEFVEGGMDGEQVDAVVAVMLIVVDKNKRERRQKGAVSGGVAAGASG